MNRCAMSAIAGILRNIRLLGGGRGCKISTDSPKDTRRPPPREKFSQNENFFEKGGASKWPVDRPNPFKY